MEIVEKIWGREEIIENNEKYCLKNLIFRNRQRNSWHLHKEKDETFFVTDGLFHLITCENHFSLKEGLLYPGDKVRIKPKTLHRLTGLKFFNKVIEVSTTFYEEDTYRKELGYEISGEDELNLIKKERYLK